MLHLGLLIKEISIHALLAESDYAHFGWDAGADLFLSTLSLRRATCIKVPPPCYIQYFYPRSPCGERRASIVALVDRAIISIHALLAESDPHGPHNADCKGQFLSTLSLRRATQGKVCKALANRFLSTLSLRRATGPDSRRFCSNQNFYPRSPCGERLFLLRKITITVDISIHALLAESDFGRAFWPGLSL